MGRTKTTVMTKDEVRRRDACFLAAKQVGWTFGEMARRAGLPDNNPSYMKISRWRKGTGKLSKEELETLEAALKEAGAAVETNPERLDYAKKDPAFNAPPADPLGAGSVEDFVKARLQQLSDLVGEVKTEDGDLVKAAAKQFEKAAMAQAALLMVGARSEAVRASMVHLILDRSVGRAPSARPDDGEKAPGTEQDLIDQLKRLETNVKNLQAKKAKKG